MADAFESPYPGYHVLDKWDTESFNDITRAVLAERLERVPERRFLDPHEWDLLHALCDRLVPQPERPHPVPIAPWIDRVLERNRTNGTRYAGMPPQQQAWRIMLAALDGEAGGRFGRGFLALEAGEQDAVLKAILDGEADARHWRGLPAKKFFTEVVLKEVVAIYYVHPDALSEIGAGGPAAPRGYVRLGADRIDPWEAPEGPRGRGT